MRSWRCWDQIREPHNIWRAWREFSSGKRRRPNVATFALDAPRHVVRLAAELSAGTYRPRPFRVLRITDPKRRLIAAAPVRDRVVHHAIHRVLAPRLNRSFIDHSYACLEGRGSHRAVLRFRGELQHFRYVMQLDLRGYFYSIDREILFGLLSNALPEAPLQRLLKTVLESGAGLYQDPEIARWLGWNEVPAPGLGLPIGNLTSQWWGNLYLDGLDHFVKRTLRIPSYQRYMDDVTLFADDREQLVEAREQIARWLWEHRHLELKDPTASALSTNRRHPYLGYRISRGGIEPGARMRGRLPGLLAAKAQDPARVGASIAAIGAAWMFG